MVQEPNLDSGINVSLFFVWQLDGAVAQQTVWKQSSPTTGSCELFLVSSTERAEFMQEKGKTGAVLTNRRGVQETKSLLENERFLWSPRSFRIWSLKEHFSLWLSDHNWALSRRYRLSAWPRGTSRLPCVTAFYLFCYPAAQGLCIFGCAHFLLPLLGWVCAVEGVWSHLALESWELWV